MKDAHIPWKQEGGDFIMKNLFMAITMFIVAFGFVAMTMADAKVKSTKLNGQITAVDPSTKTVTVKGKDNKDYTLMVTDKTSMSQGKEKKGMGDLQPGT